MPDDVGLWMTVVPNMWERVKLLSRQNEDGSRWIYGGGYGVELCAALSAIADEYQHWPTPQRYRITPGQIERHPVLIRTVIAGPWRPSPFALDAA